MKLERALQRKPLPLRDKSGACFGYGFVDPIVQALHEVDLRAAGRVGMPEAVANPETSDQYYVNSLFEEAITSSQIEGATTTRQVAKEMLRTGRPARDRSERMILNNYRTMRRLRELTRDQLSADLIFELQRLVTEDTIDDATAVGRFRRPDEHIIVGDENGRVFHTPPKAEELKGRMEALCAFANDTTGAFVHPVVRAIALHFMLAYDHPFVDGNGRTARALFYWAMLRSGYWLVEYLSISAVILRSPAQYSTAFLRTETDETDLTYFLLYHLKVLDQAITGLHEYLKRKSDEVLRVDAELRGMEALNHRQRALIRHAIRHPGKRYVVAEHQRSHAVVYETARSDLMSLVERGLLRKERRGNKWTFTAAPDLTRRLTPGR